MTRVLVCGGRDFGEVPIGCPSDDRHQYEKRAHAERRLIHDTLDALHVDRRITLLIHGASRGADGTGGYWARRKMIEDRPFPADWIAHGKAAGPMRNQLMLDEGEPDLVVAFPGGSGTADMVRRAKAAGVEVIEVPRP